MQTHDQFKKYGFSEVLCLFLMHKYKYVDIYLV